MRGAFYLSDTMKTYNGIERVLRAIAHDDRRHTDKRRAYKTLAAYDKAKRKGAR